MRILTLILCILISCSFQSQAMTVSIDTEIIKSDKDSDGDGVADSEDKCPGTGPGIEVDSNGCPKDSDNDGIINTIDKCPFLAGDVSAEGCPDKDGDGIEDIRDKCPKVAGTLVHVGCPDADGDGITDLEDQCPDIFGSSMANGCPDADYDGVLDDSDDCPFLKGSMANRGCPLNIPESEALEDREKLLFNKALEKVKFIPGKTGLTKESYSILDEIVLLLQEKGTYKVLLLGYTDDQGPESLNLQISKKRVEVIKNYLVGKNIAADRISAIGKGEQDPISSNDTWRGRYENRRIEFRVFY